MSFGNLGSLEHKIFPTVPAIEKFTKILTEGLANGAELHIVWGPDLEVIEVELDDYIDDGTESHINDVIVHNGTMHVVEFVTRDEE